MEHKKYLELSEKISRASTTADIQQVASEIRMIPESDPDRTALSQMLAMRSTVLPDT